MSLATMHRHVRLVLCCGSLAASPPAIAQGQQGRGLSPQMRQVVHLDLDGQTAQARAILQPMIDTTSDPSAKADAQRAMAMSYALLVARV